MLSADDGVLAAVFGPLGPILLIGALGVVLIVVALMLLPKRKSDPLDKLRRQLHEEDKPQAANGLRSADYSDKLAKFAQYLEPTKPEELSAARLRMMRAGYRAKHAVRSYHAAQFVLGMGLLGVGLVYTMLTLPGTDVTPIRLVTSALLPGLIGYYLPLYWVERRVQGRREEMIHGFPDSLDMMLVCVEAGQSLDQSIIRVAREIKAGYPALGEEYEIVAREIRAGKERAQVLRDFGHRSGVPDINSFATTMVQSATFGTSIAEALRIYSAEMRDKRIMRAEEKANVIPTKLTLGTMLFTVPPLMIILIGPSLHGIAKTLGGGGF